MNWTSGIVEKLKRGEDASFRPHGNSMTPMIKSGQLVTVSPCDLHGEIACCKGVPIMKGDAVFCRVGGRLMLHLVTAIRAGQYQISNTSGHVNGWTMAKNIFGRLTQVAP